MSTVDREEDAGHWNEVAEDVSSSIRKTFWDGEAGLFRAATVCCKEHDIWGSAFAVYLGVAEKKESHAVAAYFKKHYAQIVRKGQIRHLPGGVYWEKGCKRDTYQNGAYWATPVGWFVYTLDLVDGALADRTVIDLVDDFKSGGICEWIFGETRRLPNYLASAAHPLAGIRAMIEGRKRNPIDLSLESEPAQYTLSAQNLEVRLSENGRVVGIVAGPQGAEKPVTAETLLAGCRLQGAVRAASIGRGAVEFEKLFVSEAGTRSAVVVERFVPCKDSIRWEVEVRGTKEPWSTPIETRLHWPEPARSAFWTAWGDPRPEGGGWADPLQPGPWRDREFLYGGHHPYKDPNTFALPLASILDRSEESGMSLVLSPEDLILTMKMATTAQGALTFSRENHRLCEDNVVRFAADLTAHPADWRGGVGWLVDRYPDYFDPPNRAVHSMAGCGAYSSHAELTGVERLMQMAFRVNWKASFDFPYMGMFLPPVASDDEEWTDFKGQKATIVKMRDAVAAVRRSGFYLLNYFNVTELGAHYQYPPPPRKAASDADLWKDANDFLFHAVGDAIRPGAPSVSPPGGYFDGTIEVVIETPRGAPSGTVRYTMDGTTPTRHSAPYTDPLRIDGDVRLRAKRFFPESESLPAAADFVRRGPKPPAPDLPLGDLAPLKATVGWGGRHRVNRSIADSPLSVGRTVYEHGIGVHAHSVLEYEIERDYTRFVAIIGVDDAVRKFGGGSVVFEVVVDGQSLFCTPVLGPGDLAHVDLEIPAGAEIIRLEAADGGDGISCDHADWVEAGFLLRK